MTRAETLTITLTGRPPVKIVKAEWPIIAEGHDPDGSWIRVRLNTVLGKVIVYGVWPVSYTDASYRDWFSRGGHLVSDSVEAITVAIKMVAADIDRPELVQRTIADLPAVPL